MEKEKQRKKGKESTEKIVEHPSEEQKISSRGRTFQGRVVSKFPKRVAIEFERTVYIPKYERYMRKKTRLHARLPQEINAEIGDLIQIRECRPLSKIIHFVVVNIIKKAEVKK